MSNSVSPFAGNHERLVADAFGEAVAFQEQLVVDAFDRQLAVVRILHVYAHQELLVVDVRRRHRDAHQRELRYFDLRPERVTCRETQHECAERGAGKGTFHPSSDSHPSQDANGRRAALFPQNYFPRTIFEGVQPCRA
jgi:hypothetical protein